MPVTRSAFGAVAGKPVELFTLTNAHGLVAKIITLGGILTELHTPDRKGQMTSIVLGFKTLQEYLAPHPFFGALVGRYANRIANARFTIDGKTYNLPANNGKATLHGGPHGFDKMIWTAGILADGIRLDLTSPAGDAGFPGTLQASVIYRLTDDDHLVIEYSATTDAPTHVNLTNHSYFNLAGAGSGDVLKHVLYLNADTYTPVDETLIPTGELRSVAGTPFDFRTATPIGARIAQLKTDGKGGYDHNYVINGELADMKRAAILSDPSSGRAMEVHTTQPGVQLYTSNFLDPPVPGVGGTYGLHAAACLETQHFPDTPNQPTFPTTLLRPDQTYIQRTTFKFFTA